MLNMSLVKHSVTGTSPPHLKPWTSWDRG